MSWTARITKAPNDELRLQFSEPLEAEHESGAQPCARTVSVLETPRKRVRRSLVLALTLLALLVVACGGSADSNTCPHRAHQVTDAAGNVTTVDNTPAEDQQVCDYLAYLAAHVHDGVVDCGARQGVTGGQCGDAGAGGAP